MFAMVLFLSVVISRPGQAAKGGGRGRRHIAPGRVLSSTCASSALVRCRRFLQPARPRGSIPRDTRNRAILRADGRSWWSKPARSLRICVQRLPPLGPPVSRAKMEVLVCRPLQRTPILLISSLTATNAVSICLDRPGQLDSRTSPGRRVRDLQADAGFVLNFPSDAASVWKKQQ